MGDDRPKILVIDDDKDFIEILTAKLTAAGFDVVSAGDGQTGIETAKTYRPHLILLDVQMPGMSGVETLSKIKADPELADQKVIFLTSFGESDEQTSWVDTKFAQETGALGHIKKSDDLEKIVQKMMEIIYPKQ